jgi:aryl-alcohol dehydrogenase-like predicted oxidoreductase
MKKVTFGKTGFSVSPLGFGGAPMGFLKTDQDRVAIILNLLLDSGANVIDTAAMYPGSEQAIGNSVGHRRKEYVLVSKCGQAFEGLPGAAWSAQVIAATVERALKWLKTDHLDVMLLHSCPGDAQEWRGAWRAGQGQGGRQNPLCRIQRRQ